MPKDIAYASLSDLETAIARDLSYLNYPPDIWVKPLRDGDGDGAKDEDWDREGVLDVAIIGAGACGLAAAFGLMREGVQNIRLFDRRKAGLEGPWVTTARMQTLRSPKHLTGPNMGLPNLTFRAWFEARWDGLDWARLDKIPRQMWMDYLVWYRKVLAIPVENESDLVDIEPGPDVFRLHFNRKGERLLVQARHVVLATGRAAFGGVSVPDLALSLPPEKFAHTEDAIDFKALKGKNVVVIGGAASAADSAATALENGAEDVHMLVRAPHMPRLNKFKSITYPGFLTGFSSLDKVTRWRFLKHGFDSHIAAPRDSMLRLKQFSNFRVHLGAPVLQAEIEGERVRIKTPDKIYSADFVIFATGYAIDITRQPELRRCVSHIRLWRDCFDAPSGEEDAGLGGYPFLGNGFEFLEKEGQAAPYLKRLHLFNAASTLTHAPISSDIPGVNIGVSRLVEGLVTSLFVAGKEHHLADFYAYDEPELQGDEWI